MRSFEVVRSSTDTLTSHSGLALVGRGIARTSLARDLDTIALRHGIAHSDCVISYVALLATGILRWIRLVGLLREDAPVRHDAKRRRLKTVMQELMYVAARVVESGRRLALKFSHRCPAFPSFEAVYAKLAPA